MCAATRSMSSNAPSVPFEYWRNFWESAELYEAMGAGACAAACADALLFPLDALRTRLQAPQGFQAAGGLRGIYRGFFLTLVGSVPCSSLFFVVYEPSVTVCRTYFDAWEVRAGASPQSYPQLKFAVTNAIAAAFGELVVSVIRTPLESVKQRAQSGSLTRDYLRRVGAQPALLWRGWSATLLRDLPFSVIQYPLYALLKKASRRAGGGDLSPAAAGCCGSLSAATAAAVTTPMDVIQTRIMLTEGAKPRSWWRECRLVCETHGKAALFRGVVPRTTWMGLSGLVFLGSYEQARCLFRESHRR